MSLEERLKYAEMKARHSKELRPWYRKPWGVFLLIILAIILLIIIFSGIYIMNKIDDIKGGATQKYLNEQRATYLKAIAGYNDNYYLGTNQPQVTIVEFSDFACPYCQASILGVKKVAENYGDRVKIIFRDYPLHEDSIDLAVAARCAGEQNKFWEMHDALFANQDRLTATGDELNYQLQDMVKNLNLELNLDQFNTCLIEKKYLEQVRLDFEDGEKLGIQGTPTWFINNYVLTGYLSEEKMVELVTGLIY